MRLRNNELSDTLRCRITQMYPVLLKIIQVGSLRGLACAAEINRTEGGPLRAVPFRPLFLAIFRTKPAAPQTPGIVRITWRVPVPC